MGASTHENDGMTQGGVRPGGPYASQSHGAGSEPGRIFHRRRLPSTGGTEGQGGIEGARDM